jgi:alginate O-acetyltransferase complex protein AlgI
MLLGGLWHGAAWTFVVWGGLHGSYLIAERKLRERFSSVQLGPLGLLAVGLLTYLLVNLTWVFFRAKDFPIAWQLLRGMLGLNGAAKPMLSTVFIVSVSCIVTLLVGTHWYMRERTLESVLARAPPVLIGLLWGFMAFAIVISQGRGNAFIYFQF